MGENELAKYPGLFRRGGVWQVQKKVPIDLRSQHKRDKVQKTLRTGDFREAVRLYPQAMAEIVRDFDEQRAELGRQGRIEQALSAAKLERLSRAEIDSLVWGWWEKRSALRKPVLQDDYEAVEVIARIEEDLRDLAAPDASEGDPAERLADRLLVEAGMASFSQRSGRITTVAQVPKVNRATEQYRYLRERVGLALEIEAKLARDYLKGERTAATDPQFNPADGETRLQLGVSDRRLGELVAAYRRDREKNRGGESTRRKYSHIFRALEEILGPDKPVAEISRADCRSVRDFLQQVPASAGKKYPGLSLREAVEAGKRDGAAVLAPNTVNSYLQALSAIFNWARKEDWLDRNPAEGLVEGGKALVKRRGFEPDELRKVFEALRFEPPSRFWISALGLYSGARLNELCQLSASDIGEADGIHFMDFSVFDADSGERLPDRSLKTQASDRRIPIHPELIEAGFLKFVDGVRERGGGRLFSDLKLGPDGKYSHSFSKWFAAHLDRVGLPQRSLVFHSFRHGIRDACREAEISEEIADALGGWTTAGIGRRYGNRSRLRLLARASAKVHFPDFRLADFPRTVGTSDRSSDRSAAGRSS